LLPLIPWEKNIGQGKRKERHVPSPIFFSGVQYCVRLTGRIKGIADYNRHIDSSVQSIRYHTESHCNRVERVQYKATNIIEQKGIAHESHVIFTSIPKAAAIAVEGDLMSVWGQLPADQREQ